MMRPDIRESRGYDAFIQRLSKGWSEAQVARHRDSTRKILERSISGLASLAPGETVHKQIVIGQVQSGKTSSFESVIRLARDNGFPVAYLLGGNTKILLTQSVARFAKDYLVSDVANRDSAWQILTFPNVAGFKVRSAEVESRMSNGLEKWFQRPESPYSDTFLLASLKTPARLKKVAALFQNLHEVFPELRLLVVDDESDQASPDGNASNPNGEWTSTHERIAELQSIGMPVAYIMYTATPAANLLSNFRSAVSPDSLTVLEPGAGYVGPKELFIDAEQLYRTIPKSGALQKTGPPPQSLIDAVNHFLMLLCVLRSDKMSFRLAPLSMLIHPHRETQWHARYANWAFDMLEGHEYGFGDQKKRTKHFEKNFAYPLERIIEDAGSPESLVRNEPEFWIEALQNYLSLIQTVVLNSKGRTDPLKKGVADYSDISNWDSKVGWILVGGDKLSRGFTVENLAVTYLARDAAKTADTNQQRGRFFGYRGAYLKYLRIWMHQATYLDYREHAIHNTKLFRELQRVDSENLPVDEWERVFTTAVGIMPTRRGVISPEFEAQTLRTWFRQTSLFPQEQDYGSLESKLFQMGKTFGQEPFAGDLRGRSPDRKHQWFIAPLHNVREMVEEIGLSEENQNAFDARIAAIGHQDRKKLEVAVLLMDALGERKRADDSPLFSESDGTEDSIMFSDNMHTFQFHHVVRKPGGSHHICVAHRMPGESGMTVTKQVRNSKHGPIS
jgi:hypothetical protein